MPKAAEPSTPNVYAKLAELPVQGVAPDKREDRRLPRSVSSAAFGSREMVRPHSLAADDGENGLRVLWSFRGKGNLRRPDKPILHSGFWPGTDQAVS